MKPAASLLLLWMVLGLALPGARALSWPLCSAADDAGSGVVWVTERPATGAAFPGAHLWLFCDAPTVLGAPLAACARNGTVCDPGAVLDAACALLGASGGGGRRETALPCPKAAAPAHSPAPPSGYDEAFPALCALGLAPTTEYAQVCVVCGGGGCSLQPPFPASARPRPPPPTHRSR